MVTGTGDDRASLFGAAAGIVDGSGDLLQCGGSLLNRSGLLFRAFGKIIGGGAYLVGARGNRAGIFRYQRHRSLQLFRGCVEIRPQSLKRGDEWLVNALR